MKPRSGVLAAGNWVVDCVKVIDHFPEQDTLCLIEAQDFANGGGPYNLLKDLARMEAPFSLAGAGLIGEDAYGSYIREDCRKEGIDSTYLSITRQAPTSFTDVMSVRATGRRTFFHQKGANALFDEELLEVERSSAKWFYLGYLLLLDRLDLIGPDGLSGAARLLRRASAAGLKTMVDLVSASNPEAGSIVSTALPFVDVLLLNEIEAAMVLERAIPSNPPPLDWLRLACRDLHRMGVREWVILHHSGGALAVHSSGNQRWQASLPLPPGYNQGAAGAGDAFASGILLGLHEEWKMEDCLHLAVSAAAACLAHPTTSGGMRPWKECWDLARLYPPQ